MNASNCVMINVHYHDVKYDQMVASSINHKTLGVKLKKSMQWYNIPTVFGLLWYIAITKTFLDANDIIIVLRLIDIKLSSFP